jgi:hypothetical protein
MAREPHHRLLFANDQVRVFELSLRRSEQALVRHENNFLVITLSDSEIAMWPEGRSDIQSYRFFQGDVRFLFGGRTIGMRNDQINEYRSVIVEFLDPKVTTFGYQPDSGKWSYGNSVLRPPVDPSAKFSNSMELGDVTVADVQLLQADALEAPEKETAELLVPVTAVDLKHGLDIHVRKSSGEAWWIGSGRKEKLVNTNAGPARFVLVQFHQDGKP